MVTVPSSAPPSALRNLKVRPGFSHGPVWRSPMGPLSISYAFPLRKQDTDQVERLQFSFGGQL